MLYPLSYEGWPALWVPGRSIVPRSCQEVAFCTRVGTPLLPLRPPTTKSHGYGVAELEPRGGETRMQGQ